MFCGFNTWCKKREKNCRFNTNFIQIDVSAWKELEIVYGNPHIAHKCVVQ